VAQQDVEEILAQVVGTGARRLDQVVEQLEAQLKQHARQLTMEMDDRYQRALADEMSTLRSELGVVASELANIVDEQRSRLLLAGAQVNEHHQQLDREFAELDAAALADVRQSLTQWQESLTDDVPLPKMSLARSHSPERGTR
jgi:ABC-type phosphate transport system auxiliary subunit